MWLAVQRERGQRRRFPPGFAHRKPGTAETQSKLRARLSSMVPSSPLYDHTPRPIGRERDVRGDDQRNSHLCSYLSPEQRVPADHPLRSIRTMTDDALKRMSPRFEAPYASSGRPSVPPEQLLRALLLQVLYSVRSERLLTEQLQYNLLFRWFSRLDMAGAVWPPTTFTR